MDDVINRGGEKISPLEVERRLLEHPTIQRALVFAVPHSTLHQEVVAAIVPMTGLSVDDQEIRAHLAECLPPSRIPRRIICAQQLPVTSSGKPNRRGAAEYFDLLAASPPATLIPTANPGETSRKTFAPNRPAASVPAGIHLAPLEKLLRKAWCQALRRDDIGFDDDFFNCGGDSLSAIRLVKMIEDELPVTIPLKYLMEAGSVRKLARRLYNAPPPMPDVVGIQTDGRGTPIFAVGGRFGYALRLLLVGRALGATQPFYGLQPPDMDWDSVGLRTIPEFAAHYIDRLRKIQPSGPYRLLGTSFGGLVVHEMALQLQATGHEVQLLAMVDTSPTACRVRGHFHRDDPFPLDESGKATAEALRVAQAHLRARSEHVLQHRFPGTLIYFWCDGGDSQRDYLRHPWASLATDLIYLRNRIGDRRRLWAEFAAQTRFVRIPGKHGEFHREPQFGALCQALRALLEK
jgi:thioesterase domain-containing protein/acyl carrier protein